ncbi:ATP-binding protein [Noviherbaspirillum sp. CPCC 100848]|uniref:histidine kinase n=1 Tax=Noviherbaspirillum album TaxID=3080276 RepID=A0ABU6JIN3_9BURK|nr:ATP-binding protein [Noviherbaspirillum sp. CPCC 100848]MEC4723042.1 ATP-binding protein [Noviherbaspirillum sp. CPCC 100848]
MKVKSHLAVMVTAVLVPIVFFSGWTLLMLLQAERDLALRNMHEVAHSTMLAIDQEMAVAFAISTTLATSHRLKDADFAAFYEIAIATNKGRNTHTSLLDNTGLQLFNTLAPYDAELKPPLPTTTERINKLLATNEPAISDLILGSRTRSYLVAAETPVTIDDGRRFVITEWLYVNALKEKFPKTLPDTWLISLFDRNGITIARNIEHDASVGKPPLPEIREFILAGTNQFRGRSREGLEVYAVTARSSLTGWTVGIGVPVSEIENSARQAAILGALGLFSALLIGTFAAYLFGRKLLDAVRSASSAASLLGQGKIPERHHSSLDEVNELHEALLDAGKVLREANTAKQRHLQEVEEARNLAESQSRAKDEYLAMLGHELRNPLAAIHSAAALLRMDGVSETVRRRAQEVIERQSDQLSSLVDELLDSQRILSGKITLSKAPVDLADAVRHCYDSFEAQGIPGKYRVSLRLERAMIVADATRLNQMIANLVENAFKYTPEGGTIDISVKAEAGSAVFEIKDSGVGISPLLLSNIFETFVQGPVTNRAKGGIGMGLAVVRSLARQHDAQVSAESQGEGKGTTFHLRFPLLKVQAKAGVIERTKREQTSTKKILVIEDNKDARDLLCELLTAHGHLVSAAEDGLSGVQAAFAERPDLALIDIDLPDIQGYEVATRLRNDVRTKGLRMIAVTGYGQEADRIKALESGFDSHLKKPVKTDELMAAIMNA